jgi:hypothetical protein
MKAIVAASVFCIVFSLADRALFGGRLVESFACACESRRQGLFRLNLDHGRIWRAQRSG